MNTPEYWARAAVNHSGAEVNPSGNSFMGIGWSNISQDDAYQKALSRSRAIRDWIVDKDGGYNNQPDLDQQYYPDRVIREAVIDAYQQGDRKIAVLTQNLYGAYILNTAEAMFIDIDEPKQPKPFKLFALEPRPIAKIIHRLLGKATPSPDATPEPAAATPADRIRALVDQHPGMGLKLYRTPNGYRGLVTHRPYTPGSAEAEQVLNTFGSDPVYATLCKIQDCFRARLSPKPWRIGMDCPPRYFPFSDARKPIFEKWKAEYDRRITNYAACEPLSNQPWGNPNIHPDIAPVLALHDELACSPGKPLA